MAEDITSETAQTVAAGQLRAFIERIERLEAKLAALQATVARLCAELGVSPAGPESGADHAKTAD